MPRFAPWYRRDDYALVREIIEDAEDTLPLTFDEWEKNAEGERAAARSEGVIMITVFLDPAEFSEKMPCSSTLPNFPKKCALLCVAASHLSRDSHLS